jgi:hypothetical protein
MHRARTGTALAALAAATALILGGGGVAQAAPVAQQAPQQIPAAKPTAPSLNTPVTGTFTGGTFTGNLSVDRFVNQNGQLTAVGTLTGTLTDTLGNVLGTVNQPMVAPVQATATCDILHLQLGPLDLNLLGLVVHLDQVVLDITAQQAPGNLLGNLLCAVAGLLDNPGNGSINGLVALLNQILRLLG